MRLPAALFALAIIALGVWQLEAQKTGLVIEQAFVGATPVTTYYPQAAEPAPLVVIAHGFAGSRPLMESYALAIAQAGYLVASFDFEGHGRNPIPMSGDVEAIEGTTRLLVEETLRVLEAGLAHPQANGQASLLGHSMASDIIVRAAIAQPGVGPVIAISPFSQAVSASEPANLLMITGQWEPRLVQFAQEAVQMVNPDARDDMVVRSSDGNVVRRAVTVPNIEHVGILYHRAGIKAAVDWLNDSFGKSDAAPVPARIGWIVLVLTGTVILAWSLAQFLPYRATPREGLSGKRFLLALLLPVALVPLVATQLPSGFLPVLVADYLAVHMALYGAIQLVILRCIGLRLSVLSVGIGLLVAAYGIFVFGTALDRYIASFMPHAGRLPIIAALAVGAVPYMLADSALAYAHPRLWQRVLIRLAFLVSLAFAVALDFEGLFFLVLIIPVIGLFFLIFGLMGRWTEARAGPLAAGLGLGLVLAWSLGVTFPMFV
jgi:dienelactone hydrolase